MQDFRKLIVWQRSHRLALEVYKCTSEFPRHELFALTSQLRRSAVSIPSNIAEGCGRGTTADLCRFLTIASGSACEIEYQILLSTDLSYLNSQTSERLLGLVGEVKRMLMAFIRKAKNSDQSKSDN